MKRLHILVLLIVFTFSILCSTPLYNVSVFETPGSEFKLTVLSTLIAEIEEQSIAAGGMIGVKLNMAERQKQEDTLFSISVMILSNKKLAVSRDDKIQIITGSKSHILSCTLPFPTSVNDSAVQHDSLYSMGGGWYSIEKETIKAMVQSTDIRILIKTNEGVVKARFVPFSIKDLRKFYNKYIQPRSSTPWYEFLKH